MANIPLVYNVSLSDVQTFKDFGTFQNNFDDFGNDQLVYNISQSFEGKYNYIKVPIKSFLYNENKIVDTSQTDFTELQTTAAEEKRNLTDVITQYNNVLVENRILNQTVNELVEKYENNDDKQVIAAMKNEIIGLRIQLGQGKVPSDFDDDYPFLPLTS
jgi:hypothetical protein